MSSCLSKLRFLFTILLGAWNNVCTLVNAREEGENWRFKKQLRQLKHSINDFFARYVNLRIGLSFSFKHIFCHIRTYKFCNRFFSISLRHNDGTIMDDVFLKRQLLNVSSYELFAPEELFFASATSTSASCLSSSWAFPAS